MPRRAPPAPLRTVLAALAVGALALPAPGQEGPPAAPPEAWEVRLGDRAIGAEEVRWEAAPEGPPRRCSSRAELHLTAQPFVYTQELEVDGEGRLVAYRLEAGTHRLQLARDGEGFRITGQVVGQKQDRRLEGLAPWVCLDNLVFSHYDLLGRLARGAQGPFSCTVVVPQSLVALPARFTPGPVRLEALRGEEKRRAAEGSLKLANVLVQVVYDLEDGRAYRVRVPAQRLEATRAGWSLEERSGPPAQPEVAPERYRELAVEVPAPRGALPGTLTLPAAGKGPFPVVLVLPGSGPQDRHETIGPNHPLRDLARGLAARGVATLRCDKRAYLTRQAWLAAKDDAARKQVLAEAGPPTLASEYLDDARAARAWLATREEVRGQAPFLLGHSLGGVAAAELAGEEAPAGLILLATPGRRVDALLEDQLTYQATLAGKAEAQARADAQRALAPLVAALEAEQPPAGEFLGAPLAYWCDLARHEVPARLASLEVPTLVLQGGKDCQVGRADFVALQRALGERTGSAARLFPELNHLFMPVDGPSTGAEYGEEGRLQAEVVEAVAGWVLAR